MAKKIAKPFLVIGFITSLVWALFAIARSCTRIWKVGFKLYFFVKDRTQVPDALQDPSLGEHGYLQLSNAKIHYVSKGPSDAPLMLFLHGFPEFWYSWRHQLREFGGDYRAVAIDMRGFGDSDKPRGIENYKLDKLVRDVKEVIEDLGYEKCTLVAHDWGGAVAWCFAQMHPEMIDKMVMCNMPHPSAFLSYLQTSWKQYLMSWYVFFFQLPWLPEITMRAEDFASIRASFSMRSQESRTSAFTDDDIDCYKYTYSKLGRITPPINYYRAIYQYGIPLDFPTETVKVPTIMIWGKRDRALLKATAEETASYCEQYLLKYVDASHWVQQEQPQIVNDYMREFLAADF